jgi:hypothetical protein
MVLIVDVLVNRVVRKARKRKASAREEDFDLIRARELTNAIEDICGLFSRKHSDSV